MPQVPYSSVPDVAPQDVPAPLIRERTDPNMFGGNVARSIEGMGTTLDKVGDELYSRALAMQQLQNETAKTNAAADLENRVSERRNQFLQQQGQNASPDALSAFREGVESDRQSVRAGLPNDMSRKMFDGEAFSIQRRAIDAASIHSATELRRSAVDTSKARQDAIRNTVLTGNPVSSEELRARIRESDEQSLYQSDLAGDTPD